jgi:hypothetical protein
MPDPNVQLHDRFVSQDDEEVQDENEENDPQDIDVEV